jgi:cell division septal protein FtsQ
VFLNFSKIFKKHESGTEEGITNSTGKRQIILLVGVFLIIACLGLFANGWTSNQLIGVVRLSGNSVVMPEEIISLLDSSLYTMPKESVSLLEIQKTAEAHPYVKKSFAMTNSTNELLIEIEERKPVAYIVIDNGISSYVDEDGIILPFRFIPGQQDLILFRNMTIRGREDLSAVKGALEILSELKESKNGAVSKLVSEILWDKESLSYTLKTSDVAIKIYIGAAENISGKIDLFYSYWVNKQPNDKVYNIRYIDLRWDGQLVVNTRRKRI